MNNSCGLQGVGFQSAKRLAGKKRRAFSRNPPSPATKTPFPLRLSLSCQTNGQTYIKVF
jgi:hypothetical protein